MDSGDRLAEYRAYYRARAARYAADPMYPESAAAEAAMADAVDAAGSFEELRATAVQLSLAMGRALARDQANARAAVYAETAESVRALGPAEVLASVDSVSDGPALAALLGEIEHRVGMAVSADELTRWWTTWLTTLENVEVWRTAEVPDRWRDDLEQQVAEALADARHAWGEILEQAAQLRAGWRLDPDVARAERHRRLLPVPDEVFEQRLAEHGSLIRGEGA